MKKYIIAYWFRNKARNYFPFYDALKENFPENRHVLEDMWVVKTDKSANEIYNALKSYLTFKDYDCDTIFVGELGDDWAGMIAKTHWKFIKDEEEQEKVG